MVSNLGVAVGLVPSATSFSSCALVQVLMLHLGTLLAFSSAHELHRRV